MSVYDDYEPPVTQGLYHKFENGKQYLFRFLSDPVIFNTEYNGQISEKYAWLVWNIEDKIPQVIQLPVTAYRTIASYAKDPEYGDPSQYSFKMKRTGEKLDTKYEIIPSPNKSTFAELIGDADELMAAEEASGKIDLIEVVSKGKGVSNVDWLSAAAGRKAPAGPGVQATTAAGPGPEDKRDDNGDW